MPKLERHGHFHVEDIVEDASDEVFGHGHDVLFADEAHFHVDLGEFGLAVSAQILVTEAAHDLEILFEAGAHEQLLEELGRLGQGVELALVEAARHEEVAGALGRGLGQERRLDFNESALVEEAADGLHDAVPEDEVLLHAGTAQIEIAPGKAQVLAGVAAVLDGEGRGLGSVEQLPVADHDLDLTGFEVGVGHALGPRTHLAPDGDDVLEAENAGALMGFGIEVRREDNLGQAFAVAQVDEDKPAVVAAELHPAHEADFPAVVGKGQLRAAVGALPVTELGDVLVMLQLEILNLIRHD